MSKTKNAGKDGPDLPSLDELTEMADREERARSTMDRAPQTSAMRRTLEFSRATTSILEIDELLNFLIERFIQLLEAERGFLLRIGPDGKLLFTLCKTFEGREIESPGEQVSHGVVEEVIRSGRAVVVANAVEDPSFGDRESIKWLELLSVVCAPLVGARTGTLGAIYLDNRSRVGRFTEEDRDMLEVLANQAGIAIENADLFNELKTAQDQLANDRQVKLVGQIASQVNSRFSEVLAQILGQTQIYLWTHPGSEDEPALAKIEEEAKRGIEVFRQLEGLDYSADEARRTSTSVKSLVESCLADIPRSQHVRWALDLQSGLTVVGDRAQLQRALVKILANSVEAVTAYTAGGEISISGTATEDHVIVRVSDNGPGFTGDMLERATDPFSGTKQGALGLGLNIAHAIIHGHGGELILEGGPGRGAVVTIRLPLRAASTPVGLPDEELAELKARVLLVDDEVEVADLLARTLAGQGHRVQIATSTDEGIRTLDEEPWDLLIVDIGFSKAALEKLITKAKSPELNSKVILLTAWADQARASDIDGVDLVASKPLQLRYLPHLVRKALEIGDGQGSEDPG